MAGQYASSEGNLIGVIDAEVFRNAVLAQRQRVIEAESGRAPTTVAAAGESSSYAVLVEIRDILARIETRLAREENN